MAHGCGICSKMGRVEWWVAEQVVRAWRMDVAYAEMHLLTVLVAMAKLLVGDGSHFIRADQRARRDCRITVKTLVCGGVGGGAGLCA